MLVQKPPVPGFPDLRIESDSEIPVYRQIADGIRDAVAAGRVQTGKRLPPTRDLARHLGINRNTVVAAYDLLVEQGFARSHTGRGTFLVASPTPSAAPQRVANGDTWFTGFSRAVEGPGVAGLLAAYRVAIATEGISFSGSYPASDLMPVDSFRRAMSRVLKEKGPEILSYGPPAGYAPLREAIAAGMRREGSPATADDVLVTNGSQQAIELVFRTFLDPGDPVAIEEPTYTGALSALASLGARLVSVPVDEHGIRTDLLAMALDRHRPRVLYVQPNFQNPTTRVLSLDRRRELLDLAARYSCTVVEDEWAGDLRFEGENLPSLHALDGGRRVVHLSTFSKKLLPGLRVGWATAPAPVLERLLVLKQIEDHGTSLLVQAALHAFLEDGGLEEHLDRVRVAYRERREAMLEALDAYAPDAVRWTRPEGGLFLWVTLPETVDGGDIFAAARERGVLFSRGELFHPDGGGRNTMRLTFSSAEPEAIRAGIRILGTLLRERIPQGAASRPGERLETVPIL